MAPQDVEKTAVTTPFGLFEFIGMPLGLRNATQTFQRHMDALFRNMPFVKVYLYDVLITSPNLEEHLQHLRAVLKVLSDSKLSLNPFKFAFAQEEITFLEFHVNEDGFMPPPDRVTSILEYPKPPTIADLRRLNGVFNDYRALIPNAA